MSLGRVSMRVCVRVVYTVCNAYLIGPCDVFCGITDLDGFILYLAILGGSSILIGFPTSQMQSIYCH